MICKKCGANVPDDSNVCSVCGASITASPFMQAADLDGFGSGSVSALERNPGYGEVKPPEIIINMGDPAGPVTMTKYCAKCGAPMEADSRFCTGCGAGVDGGKDNTGSKVKERVNEVITKVWDTVKSKKQLFIIGGAVAALVLVVGIALFALLGGRSAEATVKQYVDASIEGDGGELIELIPQDLLEYMMEEEDMAEDEVEEYFDDMFADMYEGMDEYDVDISYKISAIDEVSNKKLRNIQDEYDDEFDIEVKAAKTAKVKITAKIEGEGLEAENSETIKVALIKIGNSWYIDALTMGDQS